MDGQVMDDFVLYNDCDTGGELTFAEGHIAMSQTLPTVKLGNVLAYACIIIGILQPARYKGKNKIMKAITLHRVPPMRTKGRYFCLG